MKKWRTLWNQYYLSCAALSCSCSLAVLIVRTIATLALPDFDLEIQLPIIHYILQILQLKVSNFNTRHFYEEKFH